MTGLAAAVAAYNQATRQLDEARRLLYRAMDAAERQHTARRERAECGTPSGYNRHRLDDEIPCPACTAAHTRDKRQRDSAIRRAS